MDIRIRAFEPAHLKLAMAVWNEVVEEGLAFPQVEYLTEGEALPFFSRQNTTFVACDGETGQVLGLYILHPNNVGRCGHIGNASYAVFSHARGRGIGEKLVRHCLTQAKAEGYRLIQFNAVVANNHRARSLYKRLGFQEVGKIPGGFLLKEGRYEDIYVYYYEL